MEILSCLDSYSLMMWDQVCALFLLTGPLKNSPNKLLERWTLSVAARWRITQHCKSLLLLLSFFLPLSPLPSASLLFSASITPVVFIRGSKAAVMRQSIFLGWWGRTQAISLSLAPRVSLGSASAGRERSKRRGPQRCCWRRDWWSPLSGVL